MIKMLTNDKWLIGITVMGVVLYMGFMGFVVLNDRCTDYYIYLISAYALGNGENVYTLPASAFEAIAGQLGIVTQVGPYLYPTLTALVVYPLSFLPLRLGAAIWISLSGVAALASGLILCSFTTEKWKQRVILLSTVAFFPVLTTMNQGQVNLFVLLTVVLTLYYLHHGRNVLGGLIFSMSILLKPFAIALIPLMIWRRKWKALGGFLLGVLLITMLSLAVFGISSTISQIGPLIGKSGLSIAIPSGLNMSLTVQNLNGLLGRATTGISAPIGLMLYLAIAGLVGIITIKPADRRYFEIEAALLIVTTHLITPLTWYHHLTMLIIVFALIIVYWDDFKLDMTAILLLLGLILTDMHGLLWKQLSNLHPILSNFPVLTALLLWCLALAIVRRSKETPG